METHQGSASPTSSDHNAQSESEVRPSTPVDNNDLNILFGLPLLDHQQVSIPYADGTRP